MQTIYEIGQTINNQQGSYHIKINYGLIIFDKNLLKNAYFEIVIYAFSCNSQYNVIVLNIFLQLEEKLQSTMKGNFKDVSQKHRFHKTH